MSQSPYPTCRQVMASGYLCGSPALKNQIFCHHHQRDRQRQANLRAGLAAKFRAGEEDLNAEIVASLDLPTPDDPEAALVCLSNTFLALAAGAIPEKRAALMIYNLQTINCALANVLRYRAALQAAEADGISRPVERAVTDPEPIASFLASNRQADFDFSAQQYAQRLETEMQQQTQRREDAEGFDENQNLTADDTDRSTDERGYAEAAFNADAARMQALEHGDLARPAEAPHSPEEVEAAVGAMSADDWEKYVQHLWLCGFVDDAQREKLHARIFHADRNVRAAARFLALKYAPEKVREVLAHGSQLSVASSQSGSEERIA
jgi:hypothetical protein